MGTSPKKVHLWCSRLGKKQGVWLGWCAQPFNAVFTRLHSNQLYIVQVPTFCCSSSQHFHALFASHRRRCCIVVRNIKDTLASDSYWALSHTSPCHVNFHRPLMKRPSFYQTEQLSSCAIPNQLSRGVSLYIDKQKSTCASAALLNIAWTRCCQ